MKRFFIALFFTSLCISLQAKTHNEYVILASKDVQNDAQWNAVVKTLQHRHKAKVFYYTSAPSQMLGQLKKTNPRYVAIVEKPENLNKDYIIEVNKLSRKIDDDIYADFLWGIITGYDAQCAMKMVDNSELPLTIKSAVSTVMELKSGKWFDSFAYVHDQKPGICGEKKLGETSVTDGHIDNWMPSEKSILINGPSQREGAPDILSKFINYYRTYDHDLLVTAAHATENNLEMPFSLGNIKAQDGVLYADTRNGHIILPESGKRKVYFAVGNCLIGNMNNTNKSMAAAWMNSGNAATMIGYVVPTWHGRNGWGGLKYWLTAPGSKTLAQAIYLNQQDMLTQEQAWCPSMLKIDCAFGDLMDQSFGELQNILGARPTHDQMGFFHDRNVLAYYGDPKWDVRLQEIPEENDYTVDIQTLKGQCIVTIVTKENFSAQRMAGDKFKMEHVLDIPFSYFFPQRLKNPRLAPGQDWDIAVDENFLLIYNPGFKPNQTYKIILETAGKHKVASVK